MAGAALPSRRREFRRGTGWTAVSTNRTTREVPPITDFIQQEPNEGAPTTEKTEAWIFFDDSNLYVSARCWDSQPEREVANEMRRDSTGILQNENVGVLLDTFYDRRNGYLFQANLLGGQRDSTVTEPRQDVDWSTVWDVRTQRFEQGWTVEFAIPFKSLRYDARPVQVWGINLRRIIRWKNEWTYITPVPAYLQTFGIFLCRWAPPCLASKRRRQVWISK